MNSKIVEIGKIVITYVFIEESDWQSFIIINARDDVMGDSHRKEAKLNLFAQHLSPTYPYGG